VVLRLSDGDRGSFGVRRVAGIMTLSLAVGVAAGCASHPIETGYADQGKMQIQFFSPPGAQVTIVGDPTRMHQINEYPADGERLERTPEEYSVFNLAPGKYEFKYTAADGLDDVSVYGEFEIHRPCRSYARNFMRRSFVPISLPSEYYRQVSDKGDELFAYRGEQLRTAIDAHDLERLRQGDIVEKVFVVADLKKAERIARRNRIKLAELDRELEYAEVRFKNAYAEFRLATDDPWARFWGEDREFIKWERKRLELEQKIADVKAELDRAEALLRGDRVIVRRGMMVIATEQVVRGHREVENAADEIGEVLLVMRLGGRHMHWGEPARELAAYEP
jgi:hypothetical protein